MKALLLSAGLGTRLQHITKDRPKALAEVNGKSLLEWNIRKLQNAGVYDVVVNVHHFADQIIDFLHKQKGFGSKIEISDESDLVLETGGGLKKASHFFDKEKPFFVMNVDILSNVDLRKMLQQHIAMAPLVTLAVQKRKSSRYFLFDAQMHLKGWEQVQTGEKKLAPFVNFDTLEAYAFSGIQVLDPDIFYKIKFEGKFSLVDLYLDLCPMEKILGWDHTGDLLLDVGKPESIAKAAELIGKMPDYR